MCRVPGDSHNVSREAWSVRVACLCTCGNEVTAQGTALPRVTSLGLPVLMLSMHFRVAKWSVCPFTHPSSDSTPCWFRSPRARGQIGTILQRLCAKAWPPPCRATGEEELCQTCARVTETLVCAPAVCPGPLSLCVFLPPSFSPPFPPFLLVLSRSPHHSSLPQNTMLSVPTISVQIPIYKNGRGGAGPNHTQRPS